MTIFDFYFGRIQKNSCIKRERRGFRFSNLYKSALETGSINGSGIHERRSLMGTVWAWLPSDILISAFDRTKP